MGLWGILVQDTIEIKNLWTNPSAEIDTTRYSGTGAAISRVLTQARFGIASIQVVTNNAAANEGITSPLTTSDVPASPGTPYTFLVHLKGSGTVTIRIRWLNAAGGTISEITSSVITLSSTTWTPYWLTGTSPALTAFIGTQVRTNVQQSITFYVDGWNITNTSSPTSHIDGDQPGRRWDGLQHASTSTLDPQERGAGREKDLESTYGLKIRFMPGAGMPPVTNNLQPMALQPGALFQSSKVQPRYIDLHLSYTDDTLAAFFKKRKDLMDLFKPDRTARDQSCLLSYSGAHASKKAYIRARYDGGAEMKAFSADLIEQPVVRLLAEEPFFFEDNQEVAVLDFQDSVTENFVLRRHNGQWKTLGTGMNSAVFAAAVDKQRGRVYFGGAFTTANGVTVNRVCYWDGTTFVAMGTGVDNNVTALAIAHNGDVWVGGTFDNAGGVAAHGLARWNVASSTWTQFALGAVTDTFQALAIDPNGVLYAAGNFVNWNGNANSDNIVRFDGSTWSNLGTGTNSDVQAVAIHPDGKVYIGGNFTTANGVTVNRIAYWNGTTFVALTVGGSIGANAVVNALAIDRAGVVFATGDFTTIGGSSINRIAQWDGSQFYGLGSGLNAGGLTLAISDPGIVYVNGAFTQAGELSIADRIAAWKNGVWFHLDADFGGTSADGMALDGEDIYLGFNGSGTSTVSGMATVINGGTTIAYPIVTLVGPSSGSCMLRWLENQSSGHRLYFNLTVRAGETVTIDLRTGHKSVISDWRGNIADNPLSNSDFGSFKLLPGANTIAAFITGTTTGVTLQMRWVPQHWSLEGVAA